MLRVDGLDTINRRLEGQGQITFLRNIDWRLSLREFCPKLDARELVNGVPQLCRIIFDGANDAGKNYCKLNLGQFCREVFPAHNFLRFQGHVKTRSSGSVTQYRGARQTIRMSCQQRRLKLLFGPAISIFNVNGLVHCVFADRAPTCQAAGRRRTKQLGPEARVWLGDHDPPTPMDTAERSARALSEQTRGRDQFHPGLWPL